MKQLLFTVVVVFIVAALFGSSFGNEQYVTLYTEANSQGQNLTLNSHYANLSEHKDFLNDVSSFCAVGWIVFYTNYDFNLEGGIAFLIDQDDSTPKCGNRIFSNYNSMRYLGNRNTDLPSVSLYSKASYHGVEVLVNGNDTVAVEFPVLSLVTTGWANYTFYEGNNFNGTTWCVKSTKKVHLQADVDINLSNVGSIEVGCKVNTTNVLTLK